VHGSVLSIVFHPYAFNCLRTTLMVVLKVVCVVNHVINRVDFVGSLKKHFIITLKERKKAERSLPYNILTIVASAPLRIDMFHLSNIFVMLKGVFFRILSLYTSVRRRKGYVSTRRGDMAADSPKRRGFRPLLESALKTCKMVDICEAVKSTNSFREYPKPSENQRSRRASLSPPKKRFSRKGNSDSSRKPPCNIRKKFANGIASVYGFFFGEVKTKTSVWNEGYVNYKPFWLNKWICEEAKMFIF